MKKKKAIDVKENLRSMGWLISFPILVSAEFLLWCIWKSKQAVVFSLNPSRLLKTRLKKKAATISSLGPSYKQSKQYRG